jgi:hypothetical protein
MSDLLAPQPLFEAFMVIWPDGRATLAPLKRDTHEAGAMDLIFQAAVTALEAWMTTYGRTPHGIIGDGGPQVVATRARLYEVLGELERVKEGISELSAPGASETP